MNAKCFHIASAILIFLAIPIGLAEDFDGRPAQTELQTTVTKGMECARGVRERCFATQTSTNPTYNVSPPDFAGTNGGWYLDTNLVMILDSKCTNALVPYYANPDTVYDGTTNITMLTVTGVWAELEIGDRTNQFTGTPAIGTNPPTYGDYPWRIYSETLDERYDVLNALQKTLVSTQLTNKYNFGATASSYAGIAAYWPEVDWLPFSFYGAAAWVDTFGSGPWSIYKERGTFQFIAPSCTDVVCNVQLYGHVEKLIQGSTNEFLSFEAPGVENELLTLDSFNGPFTPGGIYTDSREFGNSSTIVPDPGSPPSEWTKGWRVIGYGLADWDFQYCIDGY